MIYVISNQSNAFGGEYTQIPLQDALFKLSSLTIIGLDTETEGLDCFTKRLLTLQLGNFDFQCVFDIDSFGGIIPDLLKDFLNTFSGLFILQNAKFDLKFLYKQKVVLKHVYDTMLAETILTHGLQMDGRDLKTICYKYCHIELDKSVRGQIIASGLTNAVITYAAHDVKYLPAIRELQLKEAEKLELLTAINLDNEFVKVLAYIEFCGIKLDWPSWKEKSLKELDTLASKKIALDQWVKNNGHTKYLDGMCDLFTGERNCTINWNSPKQVIEFFEELGIICTTIQHGERKKTVEEKVIGQFKLQFPVLELYFDYKAAVKQTSTYGLSWQSMINPVTGRIHTSFQQLMNTGRLSCGNARENKPNLQNLPSDPQTRHCFIAESGYKYIAADYCGQESIILADFSKDKNLLGFYEKGFEDMHSYVTYLLFPEIRRCPIEMLTNDELVWIKYNHKQKRDTAKTAEFAINYGGDGSTIAKNTGQSKAQGEFVYKSYFEAFSDLKSYYDKGMAQVERDHYILFNNVTRRKLFFGKDEPFIKYKDDISDPTFWQWEDARTIYKKYSESRAEVQRKSQNYRIQGSAADCSKLAGVIFFNELVKRDLLFIVKIVNMVHDEYNVEAPEEIADEIAKLLVDSMERAGQQFCQTVKLAADVEIGEYWIH